jgi:hypothetical protein
MTVEHTAYFVARLDISQGYPHPRVRECRIVSENPMTITHQAGKEAYAEMLRATGSTFAEARKRLIKSIKGLGWAWAGVWLGESKDARMAASWLGMRTPPRDDDFEGYGIAKFCAMRHDRDEEPPPTDTTESDREGPPLHTIKPAPPGLSPEELHSWEMIHGSRHQPSYDE